MEIAQSNSASSTQARSEHVWPSLLHDQLFDFTDVEFDTGFFIDDGNIDFTMPTNLDSLANTPSGQLSEDVRNHVLSSTGAPNIDLQEQKPPDFSDLISSPMNPQQAFGDIANEAGNVPRSSEGLQGATASSPGQPSQRAHESGNQNVLHKHPSAVSDTPETVKRLFDSHLCDVLSIKDDKTTNPWRVLVLPVADGCKPYTMLLQQ